MNKVKSALKSAIKRSKNKSSGRHHDVRDETLLRMLCRLLLSRGVTVRRENLSRGSAFRVKSGNCLLSGKDLIFVDKRLPAPQQLSVLLDMAVELQLPFEEIEIGAFPAPMQALLRKAAVASSQQTLIPVESTEFETQSACG